MNKDQLAKLIADVRDAKIAGILAARDVDDSKGSCNFDAPILYDVRLTKKQLELLDVNGVEGYKSSSRYLRGAFILNIGAFGQGAARTKAAEAAAEFLKERGWKAGVHYVVD